MRGVTAAWTSWSEALASGRWATPRRVRGYALLLVAGYALCALILVLTSSDGVDWRGTPVGSDFAMIWTSGRLALSGAPASVWSLGAQTLAQAEAFGQAAGLTPWHYPPPFLLVAAPLAALPYLAALALWQGATLALYLRGTLGLARDAAAPALSLLFALAFPAVFVNLGHGQTGFMVAGLWTCGLLLLPRAPVLAGLVFAGLAVKPQFGLLVPVILLAQGEKRALAGAAAGVAALGLASILVFGDESWRAFLGGLDETRRLTLEWGATGFEKIQSPFSAVRLLGGSYAAALAVQILATLATVAAVAWIWRSAADLRLKRAAVLAGALLATPYSLDYDLTLLAPAVGLLVAYGRERGFARYEISGLALVVATPLLARSAAGAISVPLGALVVCAFAVWLACRAARDARARVRTSPAPRCLSARSQLSP